MISWICRESTQGVELKAPGVGFPHQFTSTIYPIGEGLWTTHEVQIWTPTPQDPHITQTGTVQISVLAPRYPHTQNYSSHEGSNHDARTSRFLQELLRHFLGSWALALELFLCEFQDLLLLLCVWVILDEGFDNVPFDQFLM